MEKLLTAEELAERTGLEVHAIHRYARAGALPSLKIRRVCFLQRKETECPSQKRRWPQEKVEFLEGPRMSVLATSGYYHKAQSLPFQNKQSR